MEEVDNVGNRLSRNDVAISVGMGGAANAYIKGFDLIDNAKGLDVTS